jgi:hypothetical protein
MRSVFTVPVTVGCDARYTGAGPGRLHLNACVCGRIESIAGRMSGDRRMREGHSPSFFHTISLSPAFTSA